MMIASLNTQDAWDITNGTEMEPAALRADAAVAQMTQHAKDEKEFRTKRCMACGLLILATSEKFNNLLPDMHTNPSDIWTNLCGNFESKSPFHVLQLHRQFHALDLTEREDPVEWIQ